jgi:hypothetical protein
MKIKFRKGQKLIYKKDKSTVTVDFVIKKSRFINGYIGPEIWVKDSDGRLWWDFPSQFKSKTIRPTRKPKVPKPLAVTGLATEGSLCDGGVPGCTCNQSASVAQ